jgi:DUF4097 and DUF4098 domain-containing protein YvlB
MSTILRALLFIVLLLFAPHLLPAGSAHQVTEKLSGELSASATVRLENVNGRISISGWDQDRYEVVITKKAKEEENLDRIEVNRHITADHLEISVHLPKKKGWFSTSNIHGSVDLVLMVPATARLDRIKTINGGLEIVDITGLVDASSVNGGIVARDLGGDADFSSVNGGIKASFTRVDASSDMDFDTVNGSIRLSLPEDLNADIKTSVVNGRVHCDFPITLDGGVSKRKLRGRIGEGGTRLGASSVNGSIHLRQN